MAFEHLRTIVCVRDLMLEAGIGINSDEIGRRQSLTVSVELTLRAGPVQRLGETVDYRAIVSAAEALAKHHIGLIETFAQRLCADCLRMRHVEKAVVSVAKPRALARGNASTVIEMARPMVAG